MLISNGPFGEQIAARKDKGWYLAGQGWYFAHKCTFYKMVIVHFCPYSFPTHCECGGIPLSCEWSF